MAGICSLSSETPNTTIVADCTPISTARRFGISGGLPYIDPQYGDQENDVKMASVTLVDVTIHYDVDHWRFSVNEQNPFDQIYVNSQGTNFCASGFWRSEIGRTTYQW